MPLIIQVSICYLQAKCFSMKMYEEIHWKFKSCIQMKNSSKSLDAHSPVHSKIKLVSISPRLGAYPHLTSCNVISNLWMCGQPESWNQLLLAMVFSPVPGPVPGTECTLKKSAFQLFLHWCPSSQLLGTVIPPWLGDYAMDILAQLPLPFKWNTVHLYFQY